MNIGEIGRKININKTARGSLLGYRRVGPLGKIYSDFCRYFPARVLNFPEAGCWSELSPQYIQESITGPCTWKYRQHLASSIVALALHCLIAIAPTISLTPSLTLPFISLFLMYRNHNNHYLLLQLNDSFVFNYNILFILKLLSAHENTRSHGNSKKLWLEKDNTWEYLFPCFIQL